ncbi:MAG: hypothetical protein E7082_05350 [Bacteroidales bacterium]|nr:hypothetical protein [Bacteroidales bacterium]
MSSKNFFAYTIIGLCSFLLFSCVDDKYDLANKDISTDIKIPGNTVTVPLGSMKAVTLDDLIDVEDIDILKKGDDGIYAITTNDEIDPIEEHIDPISITVDPVEELVNIDFTEADITDVHISAANVEPAVFKTPTISIDDLNQHLPVLNSNVTRPISSPEIDMVLELIASGSLTNLPSSVPVEQTIKIENEEINASFSYKLPSQVKSISKIFLSTSDGADINGTPLEVVVTHPHALADIDKKLDFKVTFSDMFTLAIDPNVPNAENYSLSADGHSISVTDMPLSGNSTTLRCYIKEIVNVEKSIANGHINIEDKLVYDLAYKVNGTFVPTSEITSDDFNFNVSINVPLAFRDATGSTNEIDVDFKPVDIEYTGHFGGLENIDHIYYIEFVEDQSRIKFETFMEKEWLNAFSLKPGYALKLSFPAELEINNEHSSYEGKGTSIIYDANDHAFYAYDLQALAETHWDIHLEKLTLDDPVTNGEYDMKLEAHVQFVDANKNPIDHVILAEAELESMVSVLNSLKGEKQADFVMHESDLIIADASVHTETILSDLSTTSTFELNEKVPSEITLIEGLDFTKEVVLRFNLAIEGLDELDTDIELDVNANIPSFIKVSPRATSRPDMKVSIDDGLLTLYALYHPGRDEDLWVEFVCDRLDFKNAAEFNGVGVKPKKGADGNAYIEYPGEIVVEGEAAIHGTEFHSHVLENMDIKLDIDFTMSDMEVKNFHGLYEGEIDAVNETVDLDLGDDLKFLQEEGNAAKLAEPQLMVALENSIAIPVIIDAQIYGIDENGVKISESDIVTQFKILPASYDGKEITPVATKLFFTSSETLEAPVGYDKLLIPELADLLKPVPEQICFNLQPTIDTSVTHHVDISKPLVITGSYEVNIPLKFDEFNLCYKETIEDIKAEIDDISEYVTNLSAKAKLNIVNTIPLGLTLSVTPRDFEGNKIDDITIDDISIKPGLGEDIVKADGSLCDQQSQSLEFEIKSKSGNLSNLDKLDLVITAATNHVAGSTGIKAGQGIKISDVVIELTGDFETEL